MINTPGAPLPAPPSPADKYGSSPWDDLYQNLLKRATLYIPLVSVSASKILYTKPCLLVGWCVDPANLSARFAFRDGQDATGALVAQFAQQQGGQVPALNADTHVDSSSNGGAQANNVTLAGAANNTTFITGFEITGDGATGASVITVTITGVLGGTKTYFITIPAGVSTEITRLLVEFTTPIPASGLNTAIVVNVPSFGAGNTNAAVTAHGFQRNVTNGAISNVGLPVLANLGPQPPLCPNGLYLSMLSATLSGGVYIKG